MLRWNEVCVHIPFRELPFGARQQVKRRNTLRSIVREQSSARRARPLQRKSAKHS